MAKDMRPWATVHDAIEASAVSDFIDCRGYNALAVRVVFSAAKEWTFALYGNTAYDGAFVPLYDESGAAVSITTKTSRMWVWHNVPDYVQIKATEYIDGAAVTVYAAPLNATPAAAAAAPQVPYPIAPVVTVYEPSTTEYVSITPDATCRKMVVRPRTTTHALIYAPLITHKIADTTNTIAAADTDGLAKSQTLVDELLADAAAHIASTTYHVAAGTAIVPGHKTDDTTNVLTSANMSNLGTGYTLVDEMDDDFNAHVISTTVHPVAGAAVDFGGTPDDEPKLVVKVNLVRTAMAAHFGSATVHTPADTVNAALVAATVVATNEATAQTLINLLKGYWNSHCAVGDATADDLAGVCVHANAIRAALLEHFASTSVHGGAADDTALAALAAKPVATDATTSYALLNEEKASYSTTHCALVDGGAYITAGAAGVPIEWDCLGAFWAKTDNSGGVITAAEFRMP